MGRGSRACFSALKKAQAMSSINPEQRLLSRQKLKLAFASIGVVFGDIGTSPIYTMREAL